MRTCAVHQATQREQTVDLRTVASLTSRIEQLEALEADVQSNEAQRNAAAEAEPANDEAVGLLTVSRTAVEPNQNTAARLGLVRKPSLR